MELTKLITFSPKKKKKCFWVVFEKQCLWWNCLLFALFSYIYIISSTYKYNFW